MAAVQPRVRPGGGDWGGHIQHGLPGRQAGKWRRAGRPQASRTNQQAQQDRHGSGVYGER